MIKRAIVILLILLGLPVMGATILERDLVFKEGELLCKVYGRDCTFTEVTGKDMYAYSTYLDMVFISSKLREIYTKEQLRGVIYHEVGHIVLSHIEKINKVKTQCGDGCNNEVINNMRRRFELQADRFAVLTSKFLHIKTDLKGGLIIITPPDKYYTTHPSHPSTADRIKQIEELTK